MVKVGFVIPVMSQYKLALEAVDSIRTEHPHQIFIQRNYNNNIGVAGAWNCGTDLAIRSNCDIIFILNDDIILGQETVDHMVDLIQADDSIGVLTACDYRNTKTAQEVYDMPNPHHEVDILDAPDFACFAIPSWAVDVMGWFDPKFFPAYFEDNDYVYRTLLAGKRPVRSQNSPFFHYGSRTQNQTNIAPVVPPPVFEANRAYYQSKWGGWPGKEKYKTPFNDPAKNIRDI